jgi:hypothetical protein
MDRDKLLQFQNFVKQHFKVQLVFEDVGKNRWQTSVSQILNFKNGRWSNCLMKH